LKGHPANNLPPAAFRDLAVFAGVHIYGDTDEALYVNKSFVTWVVKATTDATDPQPCRPRTLRFPKALTVFEAVGGTQLATGVREFTFDAVSGGVYIYRIDWRVETVTSLPW
jgi:hypothetical protein